MLVLSYEYIVRIEPTVSSSDNSSNGYATLEIYRERTGILE